jgi:hypothetical protein
MTIWLWEESVDAETSSCSDRVGAGTPRESNRATPTDQPSALSGRIFSMAGRLISNLRCRLSSRNAGMIVFVNQNLEWFANLNE